MHCITGTAATRRAFLSLRVREEKNERQNATIRSHAALDTYAGFRRAYVVSGTFRTGFSTPWRTRSLRRTHDRSQVHLLRQSGPECEGQFIQHSFPPLKLTGGFALMQNPLIIGPIVFAVILAGAFAGWATRRLLPAHHLSDETKSLVSLSMAVVATVSGSGAWAVDLQRQHLI